MLKECSLLAPVDLAPSRACNHSTISISHASPPIWSGALYRCLRLLACLVCRELSIRSYLSTATLHIRCIFVGVWVFVYW